MCGSMVDIQSVTAEIRWGKTSSSATAEKPCYACSTSNCKPV